MALFVKPRMFVWFLNVSFSYLALNFEKKFGWSEISQLALFCAWLCVHGFVVMRLP